MHVCIGLPMWWRLVRCRVLFARESVQCTVSVSVRAVLLCFYMKSARLQDVALHSTRLDASRHEEHRASSGSQGPAGAAARRPTRIFAARRQQWRADRLVGHVYI